MIEFGCFQILERRPPPLLTLPHWLHRMTSPVSRREFLLVTLLAIAATYVFWSEIWHGAGIVGGDIYPYFLPQKQLLSESLRAGSLPFWHQRTSFGYPLIAESQTGVFYPPNWLFYGLLDEHRAYHVSQLAHYVVAFLASWRLAREWGLKTSGALFAALVFVYGWFPPRLCLEWAIIGGCYLPLALLCVERWLRTRRPMSLLLLALLLGCQMTAGHFHLAFITQLTSLAYALLRVLVSEPSPDVRITPLASATNAVSDPRRAVLLQRARGFGGVVLALIAAFALAAVQLGPSWELKLMSQRQSTTSREFDPGYGHIPPLYVSQVVASWWWWYAEDVDRDRALTELTLGAIGSGTNQVEAHLYFGLLPLALVVTALALPTTRRRLLEHGGWIWLLLGAAALIYAIGWLLPLTKLLPGFSFFRGLGRFGIVTTLAVGLLAGRAYEVLWSETTSRLRTIVLMLLTVGVLIYAIDWLLLLTTLEPHLSFVQELGRFGIVTTLAVGLFATRGYEVLWRRTTSRQRTIVLMLLTVADLHVVSRQVRYSVFVSTPPIAFLAQSSIRQLLAKHPTLVRLDAPGANLTNLLGVSSVPEYLGLGPIEYYSVPTQARLLDAAHEEGKSLPHAERLSRYLDWAENAGVTHVLLYDAIWTDDFEARLRLVFKGPDDFLNRAWGRGPQSPLFLYELPQTRGRVSVLGDQQGTASIKSYEANRVSIEVELPATATVVLRDLDYPGWRVTIDEQPAASERVAPFFRGVQVPAGKHRIEWSFRPTHFVPLATLSVTTLLVIAALIAATSFNRVPIGPRFSQASPQSRPRIQ